MWRCSEMRGNVAGEMRIEEEEDELSERGGVNQKRERETVEIRSSLSEPEVEGPFSRERLARRASLCEDRWSDREARRSEAKRDEAGVRRATDEGCQDKCGQSIALQDESGGPGLLRLAPGRFGETPGWCISNHECFLDGGSGHGRVGRARFGSSLQGVASHPVTVS